MTGPITVRPAKVADLDAMAAMAAELVRFHHALSPARFFLAQNVEKGYRGWFGQELANDQAILLVAEGPAGVVGYAYGRIEPRDWNMLLDRHAALHDVYAHPDARGTGMAERLVRAFVEEARIRGAPRIVLHTASENARAQALFKKIGFTPSMIEMFLEVKPPDRSGA